MEFSRASAVFSGKVTKIEKLDEFNLNDLVKISPNPTRQSITVDFDREINQKVAIKVYSALGEIIWNAQVSTNSTIIDLFDNNPGIYFLKLRIDQFTIIKKIILIN